MDTDLIEQKSGYSVLLLVPVQWLRPETASRHLALPYPRLSASIGGSNGIVPAKDCANLFRFLDFSGVRINEARNVTWADVNFDKGQLQVRITKNGKARRVPFNQSLRGLLETLRAARPDEAPEKPIMRVFECQKSIDRAAKLAGAKRITHHDLRHLFATRCIENGVDIPPVSRWLGHQDGGALRCIRTYGHLRDEHSTNEARKVLF